MTHMDIDMEHEIAAAGADADFVTADVGDFIALLKPRVMSLVVFTALVGIVVAPVDVHPLLGFIWLLAIALGAGASGALNMWYDADIDAIMLRTRGRPIPKGRMAPGDALVFGTALSVGSVLLLGLAANWTAAFLLAFTIFFYAVIYTIWLKRSTAQNIVIGGAAGAFPPMVGWAAATGGIGIEPLILFAIIFLWTPPHFWALALYKTGDYQRAGVPMLPVVAGERETRRQILLYSLLFVPAAILPLPAGFAGLLYGAVSIGLGAVFLGFAALLYAATTPAAQERQARNLFAFSVLYLFLLFSALLVERLLGMTTFSPWWI